MKKVLGVAVLLTALFVQSVNAVERLTVVTSQGGELKDKVLNSDFDGLNSLRIVGPVNAEDWRFLTSNIGIIASVKELDLSKIELVLNGDIYGSYSEPTGSMGIAYNYQWRAWPRDSVSSVSTLYGPLTVIWGSDMSCGFVQTDFEKIILPETNEGIGDYAFMKCFNLKEVVCSGKEKYIGESAFKFDSSLQKINIPSTVNIIKRDAFRETGPIELIDLSGVSEVGYHTFLDSGVKKVINTGSLETLGSMCFGNCTNIESFTIPGSVKTVGVSAFGNCESLKNLILGEGIEEIGRNAFYRCYALTEINLPSTIRIIDGGAFFNCTNLEKLNLPDGLEYVGDGAFDSTPFIKNFSAEAGIIYVGKSAYKVTKDLPVNPIVKEGTVCLSASLFDNTSIETVSLPSSLLIIGDEAFSRCKNLTEIKLPENLKSIGSKAFGEMKFTQIDLPESLVSIGDKVFYESGLTSLKLPDKIEKIGEYAFANNNFTTLTLPETLTDIGLQAFGENTKLVRINYNCINAKTDYSFRGSSCTILSIGDKVESIPEYCFYNMVSTVREINIPESVRSLGEYAIFGHPELKTIYLPESIEYLGDNAIGGSEIPISLTYNCRHAEVGPGSYNYNGFYTPASPLGVTVAEVKLGDNVETLPQYLFSKATFSEIDLKNVKEIGESAFYMCLNLENLKFPESLEVIGKKAFVNCPKAFGSDLSIPATVKIIGEGAFSENYQISRVFLPEGIEEIGVNAFNFESGKNKPDHVYFYSNMMTPPKSNGNIFGENSDKSLRTVVIPFGARNAYRADQAWSQSGEMIMQQELICESGKELNVDFSGIAGRSGDACRGLITGGAYFMNVDGASDGSSVSISDVVETDRFEQWRNVDFSIYDIAREFTGIYMKLPGCKGRMEIEVTPIRCVMEIRLDDSSEIITTQGYNRQVVSKDFNLGEPTGVWIYISSDKFKTGSVAEIHSITVTPEGTGINSLNEDNDSIDVTERFMPDGRRVNNPKSGTIVIERLSNGKARKTVVL